MGRHCQWRPKEFFISQAFEQEIVRKKFGDTSWNVKVLRAVHNKWCQYFLASLLALDILCLVTELLLDSYHPTCSVVIASCGASNRTDGIPPSVHRLLSTEATCMPYCLEQPHWVHSLHESLFWISISILLMFQVEFLILFAAIRFLFFRNVFYIIDFIVVTASIVLEFSLRGPAGAEAGGLLVVVRVWRLFRIAVSLSCCCLLFKFWSEKKMKFCVACRF
uniref:Voltage-gated hydrogen channel 1 n=1 Tax=Mucochytrium quahogii TaxID=96639 RepID=A0A7S2W746_9STRA|mmetsp:Transcript_28536/g.46000  ORF Transcript_28536/g.46000 Transcript_28536/m.46000 type:complete len:221 (+) Transcript_28536:379-1041(+)